jgi:hypothetical protein
MHVVQTNALENRVTKTAKTKTKTKAARKIAKIKKRPNAMWPLVAMTAVLLLVSLPDQTRGLEIIASLPPAQTWSLALSIDGFTMATEFALMTANNKPDIRHACHVILGMTLALSGYLNSLALGGSLENWPNILVGFFIPAAIAAATVVIAKLR